MTKAASFKRRVQTYGQDVTITPFTANAAGTYLDPASGWPDPESATYPATLPAPTYGTAVTVKGMVQPANGERFIETPDGQRIQIALHVYLAGDTVITHRDKVTVNGTVYRIGNIQPWKDGATMVYYLVNLIENYTP